VRQAWCAVLRMGRQAKGIADRYHKVPVVSHEDLECGAYQLPRPAQTARDKMTIISSQFTDSESDSS